MNNELIAIQDQFHHLVRLVPEKGRIIYNAEDPNLQQADSNTKCNATSKLVAKYDKMATLIEVGVANELYAFDRRRKISYR